MQDTIEWRPMEPQNVQAAVEEWERWSNVVLNSHTVQKRCEARDDARPQTMALVCYGPSLQETWRGVAADREKGAIVVSTSGAHDFLTAKGIKPDWHVDCDPRAHKAEHVSPVDGVRYMLASCSHPRFIEKLAPFDLSLWHMVNTRQDLRILDEIEPDGWLVLGGGNVGLRAITLGYCMGFRDFSVYGMDCSFADDGAQHAGSHAGKRQHPIQVRCGTDEFWSSAVWVENARQFSQSCLTLKDAHFHLHGRGLLQSMCREMNRMAKEAA